MSKHRGKQTSAPAASKAARVLNDPNASQREKKLAGSVLVQVKAGAETSPEMAELAAKIVGNPNASDRARSLAGSVLSQTEK